jgi:hypothetical protein
MGEKLKQGFFRVTPHNRAEPGEVVFESSTPGVYSFVPPESRLYNLTMVGGGGGSMYYRLIGPGGMRLPAYLGGGSGGLSEYNNIEMLQSQTYTIIVGVGGTGVNGGDLASNSGVIVSGGDGGQTSVSSVGYANGGTGAVGNPAGGVGHVGYGGYGNTINGNDGHGRSDTQGPADGGVSVFEGYGAGGTSYFDSPFVTDGGAGYVKIMVPEE